MARAFEDHKAVRRAVPLWTGIMGPSGTGKTFSALRLATGIQRVTGGDIYFLDSESDRALHYADRFSFRHVPFKAPFGSLDYLEALQYIAAKKPGVTIVDSMSHEHEGPGGYLEYHTAEVERLSGLWGVKPAKAEIPAWGRPAANRRRFINTALQMRGSFIFCFRSKHKLKIQSGKDPVELGWMPIAGEDFLFEMTVCALLLPGAKGVPTWQTDFPGEKMMIKDPDQFDWLYKSRKPLDEATGEALAKWAAGGAAATGSPSPGPTAFGSTSSVTDGSAAAPAMTPRPNKAALEMLAAQLVANGLTTREARMIWFLNVTGKAIADASEADVERAVAQAELEASK